MMLINNKYSWKYFSITCICLYIKSLILLSHIYQFNYIVSVFSLISLIPILLFLSPSLLLQRKNHFKYLVIVNLVISLMFFADLLNVRAFGNTINIYMIIAKGVREDLTISILSLIKMTDFLMLIDVPLITTFYIREKSHINTNITKNTNYFSSLFVFCWIIIIVHFNQLESQKLLGNIKLHNLSMSPIGNHMYDAYRYFYEKGYNLKNEDINEITTWLQDNRKLQEGSREFEHLKGLIKDKNIIAIQFESLENVVIEESFSGIEITPNINKLLKNSIYFNNIYEQVRDGNSSDAELLYNTSIYPLNKGSAFVRFGNNTYTSLPKLLKEYNYTSIAIHGDNKEFWNRNVVFPILGYDDYIDEDKFFFKEYGGMGILDSALFDQTYREIENISSPFNIHIITLTSHMPFGFANKLNDIQITPTSKTTDYIETVQYTDKHLGIFIEKLKNGGLLENSIIIIYGDHEGVHKYYKSSLPANNRKIPFIIYIPGFEGIRVPKTGGQIDIMPTIAYLLGINTDLYGGKVMGRNLMGSEEGVAILPDGTVIGNPMGQEKILDAYRISNMIIQGNYFNRENKINGE